MEFANERDVMNFLQWEGENTFSDAEISETGSSVKSETNDFVFDLSSANTPTPLHWEPSTKFNEDYRESQQILRDAIFGRTHTAEGSAPPPVPHEDYSHVLAVGSVPHPYKYELHLGELPVRSRVETQIKCSLYFCPPLEENLLHLPADTIARPRFQLRDQMLATPQALYLEVDAVLPDAPEKQVYMCTKCICREKKRAFRKKTLDLNEEYHWNETQARRLVIFNCRELVAIPMPKNTRLPDGTMAMARQIDLPLRLACYCRHHNAKSGYRLVFTVRDWQGNIVARTVSQDIFITDNHKELRSAAESSGSEMSAEPIRRVSQAHMQQQQHYTPYHRQGYERRSSSVSSRDSMSMRQSIAQSPQAAQPHLGSKPGPAAGQSHAPVKEAVVQRAIPAQGSVRGGVEVTLLGTGFHSGLTAMFGDNVAISTQCWSDNTIIAHLPPSNVAGPVSISFQGLPAAHNSAIFTYTNDSEVKLVELALQVVGFKMNGKIEDATDVASRIVNQEYAGGGSGSNSGQYSGFASPTAGGPTDEDSQNVVLQCLEFVKRAQGYVNMNLRNSEGQTMMHLACCLGYADVVGALMSQGAHVDIQDVSGMTPLHFATLFGNRAITRMLLNAHADPFHRSFGGQTAIDLADTTVVDLLPKDQRLYYQHLNTNSSSTLASVFSETGISDLNTPAPPAGASPRVASPAEASSSTEEPRDWMHFVQKLMWFGRDEPPRYLDLFPHPHRASESKAAAAAAAARRRPVIEISHSEGSSDNASSSEEEEEEEEEEEQEEEQVLESWASSPLKQIRNDHMLFTFWLPLFIIAISYVVTLMVNVGDLLQWRGLSALNKPIQRFTHSGQL